jgi:CIC family chloride channel protein
VSQPVATAERLANVRERLRDAWLQVRGYPAVRAVAEHDATRLLIAGVLVGVLGGVAAGVFDRAMIGVGVIVLGTAEPAATGPSWLRALLGPAVCGLVASIVIALGTVRKRPQSVPDVIERVQLSAPTLTLRDGVVTAVAAAIAVGGGQSGGREGPIVELASTLATSICGWLRLPPRHFRSLVAAGAAAGVAASFNTPVGGAFFALEILLGDFGVDSFAPVVAATVSGTVVGQALLGDRVALHLPPFKLTSPVELALYLVLGTVAGFAAVAFKRLVLWSSRSIEHLGLSAPVRGGLAGLGVGVLAVLGAHEVMGNGYAWMELSINDPAALTLPFLVMLLFVKAAATALTAGGKSGAGLFAPSLFLGAVVGLIVGKLAMILVPGHAASAGAYGMVGMGAVAAGVLHAPITMTLMLFEMTGNYQVILPLLVSLASAGLVSRLLGADSIYESELNQRGVVLTRPNAAVLLDGLRVRDLMRDELPTLVRATANRPLVLPDRVSLRFPVLVTDEDDRVTGHLAPSTVMLALADPAAAVPVDGLAVLREDQPLAEVVPFFFFGQADVLPVTDAAGRAIGVLRQSDVIATYHRFLVGEDALLARFETRDGNARTTDFVELPEGYTLEVVEVDEAMNGRSLRALELPDRHGCLVIAHSVWDPSRGVWRREIPAAQRRLAEGDRLVVLGPRDKLAGIGR